MDSTHNTVKEIMILRKLNHPNIASAKSLHWSHNLSDISHFDNSLKKDLKMYI
jgi:hypothetical protein